MTTPSATGGVSAATPLPALRPELELIRGASAADAGVGWLIYDPVQHRYIQIDPTSYELLSLWPRCSDAEALKAEADSRFAVPIDRDQIDELIKFLERQGLVSEAAQGDWRYYATAAQQRAAAQGPLSKLAHNYLFFRVPLFRPQKMLLATLPLVAPVYSRAFAICVALIGVLGLYLTSRQWDAFISTADFFFSWQGALAFIVCLVAVKACHELGHAYTAVRYGCYVPTMGVAFMLLTPLLYTDVTDAWKLRDRRKRLAIDGAGIAVELAIACVATFLWAFLPDGPLRSVVFMLATVGWLMSLAINLNPFMRFDGYYLLSEIVGIENLQSRSFALARWRLREILFGLGRPCPEILSPRLIFWLTLWAWCTWIYRLILFIGIAVLVYTYTFKVLGIVLFLLEIVFLVARPILSEFQEWYEMRAEIVASRRSAITGAVLAALAAALIVPWSGSVQVPAVMRLATTQPVHAPQPARLEASHVQPGIQVKQGDLLFTLRSADLEHQMRLAETELKLVEMRLGRQNVDKTDREEALVMVRRRQALRSKLAGLANQSRELLIKAPMDGTILEVSRSVRPGQWVRTEDQLALVGVNGAVEASGYLSEDDIWRVEQGTSGHFISDSSLAAAVKVRLRDVAATSTSDLKIMSLASTFGGPISVELDSSKRLVPTSAQFPVKFAVASEVRGRAAIVRGVIHLDGRPESVLARMWRRTLNVLVRESGA